MKEFGHGGGASLPPLRSANEIHYGLLFAKLISKRHQKAHKAFFCCKREFFTTDFHNMKTIDIAVLCGYPLEAQERNKIAIARERSSYEAKRLTILHRDVSS